MLTQITAIYNTVLNPLYSFRIRLPLFKIGAVRSRNPVALMKISLCVLRFFSGVM
jgi:hypothetical protein